MVKLAKLPVILKHCCWYTQDHQSVRIARLQVLLDISDEDTFWQQLLKQTVQKHKKQLWIPKMMETLMLQQKWRKKVEHFETPAATKSPKHCDANAHGPHNPICCSFRRLIMMSLWSDDCNWSSHTRSATCCNSNKILISLSRFLPNTSTSNWVFK